MLSKRTKLMVKLKFLSLMRKNHSKAEIIRKSGLFKSFGEGGTGIQTGFLLFRSA